MINRTDDAMTSPQQAVDLGEITDADLDALFGE
jgi:hypothetical protein